LVNASVSWMKSPSRELEVSADAVESGRCWLRLLGDVTVPLIIADFD